jgi:hypothetical protein
MRVTLTLGKVNSYLMAIVVFIIMLLLGILIVLTQGSAIAPFIYPLF